MYICRNHLTDFPREFTKKISISHKRKILAEKSPYERALPTFNKSSGRTIFDGIKNRQLTAINKIHDSPAYRKYSAKTPSNVLSGCSPSVVLFNSLAY